MSEPRTTRNDAFLYDSAAESRGIVVGSPSWLIEARLKLGFARPPGPSRHGSVRCECGSLASGGHREYCTCDTCY